jgi:hypothetical protein
MKIISTDEIFVKHVDIFGSFNLNILLKDPIDRRSLLVGKT